MGRTYRHRRRTQKEQETFVKRHRYPKRRGCRITRHHIVNKCMGGRGTPENILWIYKDRHETWNLLFHHLDLDGAISLLQRVKRMKGREK